MVKRKVVLSPRAKLDLSEILEFYYQRNGSKIYSKKLNSALHKTISLLEKHSNIGVYTDIGNVRNLIEADYRIFYEIKSDTIEIITIWDNRQNPNELYFKD